MAIPIQFKSLPEWDTNGGLTAQFDIDGRTVQVFISAEALKRRFGAVSSNRQDLERSIIWNADGKALEGMVRSMLESGCVSPTDTEIHIGEDDVMAVSFSDKLRCSRQGELEARRFSAELELASRELEDVTGPSASAAVASWDLSDDGRTILLHLSAGTDSVDARFDQLGKDTDKDEWRFIRLWGDLLEKKSHRLLYQTA